MANLPLELFKKIEKSTYTKIRTVKWRKVKLGYPVLFVYDAKHKDTLPYWDSLPFSVVIAKYPDGFLGLNLHYIEWTKRLQLAKLIMQKTKNKNRIKYIDIKKAWHAVKLPQALLYLCIRRYLGSHIRSDIKTFSPDTYYEIIKDVRPDFIKKSEKAVLAAIRLKWQLHQKKSKK